MKLDELKKLAKENNIDFDAKIKKADLLELLNSKGIDTSNTTTATSSEEVKVESTEEKVEEVKVEATEEKVEEVKAESTEDSVEEVVTTTEVAPKKKKSKMSLIIIIIVATLLVAAIATTGVVVYLQNKTYPVQKRAKDQNIEDFYEVVELVNDSTYDFTDGNVEIDSELTLEEQRDAYKAALESNEDIAGDYEAFYSYVIEAMADLKISDDELKKLKELADVVTSEEEGL